MSEPFTETVTEYDHGCKIRVWCLLSDDMNSLEQNTAIRKIVAECVQGDWKTQRGLAKMIADRDSRITAVEVKELGFGIVYYKEWP